LQWRDAGRCRRWGRRRERDGGAEVSQELRCRSESGGAEEFRWWCSGGGGGGDGRRRR
jgi:hypothetical protein